AGFVLALISLTAYSPLSAQSPTGEANGNKSGSSYRNDVSPPLRELPPWSEADRKEEHEANENPKIPHRHKDEADPVIQNRHATNSSTLNMVAPNVAATLSNFDGIPFPGVGCNCAPPDTTGSYYRYGFHLGSNFYDYPHLSVWPDGFYMSMNVFNSSGTAYLGPQAFAFDRSRMTTGLPATFVSPVGPLGGSVDPFLPADLDGPTLPPGSAPATF